MCTRPIYCIFWLFVKKCYKLYSGWRWNSHFTIESVWQLLCLVGCVLLWWTVCVQVSHHPPVVAMYTESKLWSSWQEFTMSSKFRGKYVQIIPLGRWRQFVIIGLVVAETMANLIDIRMILNVLIDLFASLYQLTVNKHFMHVFWESCSW